MNLTPIEVLLILGVLGAIALTIYLHTAKGQALEATAKADVAKAQDAYDSLHTKLDKLLGHAATATPVDHAGIINAAAGVVAAAQGTPPPVLLAPPAPAAVTFNPDNYPDPGACYLAWQAAGKPVKDALGRELSVSGSLTVVPGGGTEYDAADGGFTGLSQRGWFDFTPQNGLTRTAKVTAPAPGTYSLQFSGSGGVVGGDSTAHVAVTITGPTGTTTGDEGVYPRFTATEAGQEFAVTMIADKPTRQSVGLQVG